MKTLKEIKKGEIAIYKTPKGPKLEVHLEAETVWLTQKQMALLFGKGVPTINEHVGNVYKDGELKRGLTVRKFRIVRKEGKRTVKRDVEIYNLDVVISVGYRVKSKRGVQFRIWATKTLKDHLVRGYTINEKRLADAREKFIELQKEAKDYMDKYIYPVTQDRMNKFL